MRKASRHSAILLMVSVLALGLLGAAYTLWYEDLKLNVDVTTSTLNADVSVHPWNGTAFGSAETDEGTYEDAGQPVVIQCTQPIPVNSTRSAKYVYANLGLFGCTFGAFPAAKAADGTVCDAAIATWGTVPPNANDEVDNNSLTLSISGAFPYAGCRYLIDIHNSGQVPIHLNVLPPVPTDYVLCDFGATSPTDPSCVPQLISTPLISFVYGDNCFGVPDSGGQLEWPIGTPIQLHAGGEETCDLIVLLDQGDNLEHKTIFATTRFRAYQWNEQP